MIKEMDDGPLVAPTARGLGIRPGIDLPVSDEGQVEPGQGGMSVVRDVDRLPPFRRPSAFGGSSTKDTIWGINEEELPEAITYRPDDDKQDARHGVLEPTWTMELEELQLALAESRSYWCELT
jgi:hypothetical protein